MDGVMPASDRVRLLTDYFREHLADGAGRPTDSRFNGVVIHALGKIEAREGRLEARQREKAMLSGLMPGQKRCHACHRVKELTDFHRDKYKADGRDTTCAACERATSRLRRAANPEKIREKNRRFLEKHPDYYKQYRAEHTEQLRALYAGYRKSNPQGCPVILAWEDGVRSPLTRKRGFIVAQDLASGEVRAARRDLPLAAAEVALAVCEPRVDGDGWVVLPPDVVRLSVREASEKAIALLTKKAEKGTKNGDH
jgi:hypothetical protein